MATDRNTSTMELNMTVEEEHIEDVVLALFHTILFHRSSGKFCYTNDHSFLKVDQVPIDVTCRTLPSVTYVSASSQLDEVLQKDAARLRRRLTHFSALPNTQQISLEFYEHRTATWLLGGTSAVPWEVWRLTLQARPTGGLARDRSSAEASVSDSLAKQMFSVMQSVQANDYVPPDPPLAQLDTVYDTSFRDVQPYLFRVNHHEQPSTPTVTTLIRQLIK